MTVHSLRLALLLAVVLPLHLPAQHGQTPPRAALKQAAAAAWADQDWSAAAQALRQMVAVDQDDATAWFRLGYALHALRKYDDALLAHQKAASFQAAAIVQPATYNVACVYAIRKDKDRAFEWLHKAVDAGFVNVEQIDGDPDMDNLRGDPRLGKVIARMKQVAAATPMKVYNYVSKRLSTRATWFAGKGSPGQLAIDYGAPQWKDAFGEAIDNPKRIGQRWRFGADFWTSLDTNVPLTIHGTEVPAGHYYLTITHQGDRKFVLNVLDPKVVRKYRIDPYLAHLTKGGTEVALDHQLADAVAERLQIELQIDPVKKSKGRLVVRFGPHTLTAPLQVHLVR
jgi:tetratricopeptide (TPR) repeat protein